MQIEYYLAIIIFLFTDNKVSKYRNNMIGNSFRSKSIKMKLRKFKK